MKYLNFYSLPFARDNDRKVVRKVLLLESDCAQFPTCEEFSDYIVSPIATFDASTTPPTLVKSHMAFGPVVGKHPKFPDTHIDGNGNICRSSDHTIIMPAPAP